jgi:hypothetical protein
LPGVLDAGGVPAEEERYDVVVQVGTHGQLTAVERGVAEAGDAVLGGDAQGDEVPSRTGDDDLGGHDLHGGSPHFPVVGCSVCGRSPDAGAPGEPSRDRLVGGSHGR